VGKLPEDTDYSRLIDPEIWDFIRKTEACYPPETVSFSIEGQRDVYGRMCREFRQDYPEGVSAKDCAADGVPLRCYQKQGAQAAAVVLYCHGGGFVVGSLDSHDDVCAEICDQTGFAVVSVDYRLSPEHLHPAAYDDCLRAFHWVSQHYDIPLVLAGDSAGATLAAAVAHGTRKAGRAAVGMVLVYPSLGPIKDEGSYIIHANAPLLSRDDIAFYVDIRTDGADVTGDATYLPLWDTDFSELPPTIAISAQCDPISDDGQDYCQAIRNAGGVAVWINEPSLVHGYLRARHDAARARDSFARIVAAIDAFGRGQVLTENELRQITA
jgi:acetyl esterase/lipase